MMRTNLLLLNKQRYIRMIKTSTKYSTEIQIPKEADVVIIGGGIAGCSLLYQLSKRGVKALLVDKARTTSGTTWLTGGLIWRLRPHDIDIELINKTRNLLKILENETGIHSGWTNNGGLFIARTNERIEEYKRLQTLGHYYNIESDLISPYEATKLSPILNAASFKAALYSSGDGVVDPTNYCAALIKAAKTMGGEIVENCPITDILLDRSGGVRKIIGVQTDLGPINTGTIVNAAGVWSRYIAKMVDLDLPITPMKHAYVITESLSDVKNTPNIRDHDGSIYYRIQNDTIYLGGYEDDPEIIREISKDFQFALYDLDKTRFGKHLERAKELTPILAKLGIKKDVCGPEAFTPDHRPILGEDPRLMGLYHSCGYNSMGVHYSAGCAEQLAIWITEGRPELPLFRYDIRRFTPALRTDRAWVKEASHERYATNYAIIYPFGQPLAGRNHKIDPFHEALVAQGAVMEQVQGWERPGYFVKDRTVPVRAYDWYGNYDHVDNEDKRYEKQLADDYTFNFPKHHHLIGAEALAARNNVALFDLSYCTKMYLTGPDATAAADWLFTQDIDQSPGSVVYSCSLNGRGGVEAHVLVTPLEEGVGTLVGPILKGRGFYIVAGGTSGYQTISHFRKELFRKKFKSIITDVTDKLGILSIQGPKSGELLQLLTETPITNEKFPIGMSHVIQINGHVCRAMRTSFIGELGYEIHIPIAHCLPVFNQIIEGGRGFDLKHAGFRAYDSLSLEKGLHLWDYDLRIDDNPVEANLSEICRTAGAYLGKQFVERMKIDGTRKKRVFFTLDEKVPIYGLETIWRDDVIVGYLRRGNYGFSLDASIGTGYITHPKNVIIDADYLKNGNYQIEVMNEKYSANLYLKSPFDPNDQRLNGNYDNQFEENEHLED